MDYLYFRLACRRALVRADAQTMGLGRLPGDINFTVMGRKVEIPLMSTILLTAIVAVVARLL